MGREIEGVGRVGELRAYPCAVQDRNLHDVAHSEACWVVHARPEGGSAAGYRRESGGGVDFPLHDSGLDICTNLNTRDIGRRSDHGVIAVDDRRTTGDVHIGHNTTSSPFHTAVAHSEHRVVGDACGIRDLADACDSFLDCHAGLGIGGRWVEALIGRSAGAPFNGGTSRVVDCREHLAVVIFGNLRNFAACACDSAGYGVGGDGIEGPDLGLRVKLKLAYGIVFKRPI